VNIAGKIALVTGAASGIGRASAQAFARSDASVVVVDIDTPGGEETVRAIEAEGGRATFVEADVSSPEGIRQMYATAVNVYGGVDIVHNSAAIVAGENPPWPETPLEKIAQLVATNLAGTIMSTRAAIDIMRPRGGGVIINTGSVNALTPAPYEPVYTATKAAIHLFTQSCKPLKETHNVRVNVVLAGIPLVDTPILAKTGDGTVPAAWVSMFEAMTVPRIPPSQFVELVLEVVRDDSLAGEVRQLAV